MLTRADRRIVDYISNGFDDMQFLARTLQKTSKRFALCKTRKAQVETIDGMYMSLYRSGFLKMKPKRKG